MAVFGAPIAHDNDPIRAIRAAIEIHSSLENLTTECGSRLMAHIGVASGQVVASRTGSRSHSEYTVTGGSVNLASRLQDKAEAGQTLISGAVRRAVGDLVDCAPLGQIDVKGLAEPISAWRVLSLADRVVSGHGHKFVGRRNELAQF